VVCDICGAEGALKRITQSRGTHCGTMEHRQLHMKVRDGGYATVGWYARIYLHKSPDVRVPISADELMVCEGCLHSMLCGIVPLGFEMEREDVMSNEKAPEGAVYVCAMCGKRSRSVYGFGPEGDDNNPEWASIDYGWDESCTLYAVLVHEEPDENGVWTPWEATSEAPEKP